MKPLLAYYHSESLLGSNLNTDEVSLSFINLLNKHNSTAIQGLKTGIQRCSSSRRAYDLAEKMDLYIGELEKLEVIAKERMDEVLE